MSDIEDEDIIETPIEEPPRGTIDWIHYWANFEAYLPTPINISITGSIVYRCPPIVWYNFDIYPHKMKISNTGYGCEYDQCYLIVRFVFTDFDTPDFLLFHLNSKSNWGYYLHYTVLLSSKWTTERPYLMNGPFLPGLKYIFSHIHFHWGSHIMEGSDHSVDGTISHPMEMHAVYFNSLYLTQDEAFQHHDGVVIVCYLIKFGVVPDRRLDVLINAFPMVKEAQTSTRVGPVPLSEFITMFVNDYFIYWGSINDAMPFKVALWIVARIPMSASEEQVKKFRRLWDPWDEPNLHNFRPLQDKEDRHIFFVNPEWSLHNSVLPIPRDPIPSISILSPAYVNYPETIPLKNTELREKYIKEETET